MNFASENSKWLSDDDIEVFLKIYLLLYADDAVILAETDSELQLALNSLQEYCNTCGLKINVKKTKVMIFSRGKVRNFRRVTINDRELERVDEITYLGVVFR